MTTETLAPGLPVERVTRIKPSEAIRLGCLIYPVPTTGHTVMGNSACAIGAMLAGFGWDDKGDATSWADFRLIHVLPDDFGGCPAQRDCHWNKRQQATGVHLGGPFALAHLNDMHEWSRERIANWLEGLGL